MAGIDSSALVVGSRDFPLVVGIKKERIEQGEDNGRSVIDREVSIDRNERTYLQ